MKINVNVYPNKKREESNLKAMVILEIDDILVINSVKVVDSKKGLFVSMPQYKGNDGKYHDIVYCNQKEKRASLIALILDEYNKKVGGDNEKTNEI